MWKVLKITLLLLFIVYVAGIDLFSAYTIPTVKIGDSNLTMVKMSEVDTYLNEELNNKTIKIEDVEVPDYAPKLSKLGVSIDSKKIKEEINQWQSGINWDWVRKIFYPLKFELKDYLKVDSEKMIEKLQKDGILGEEGRQKVQDAALVFNDETSNYEVSSSATGNVIDQEKFIKALTEAIMNSNDSIDTSEYYQKITMDNEDAQSQSEALNQRINRNVSMEIADEKIEFTKGEVASVLYIDENGSVAVDENQLYNSLNTLSWNYYDVELKSDYRKIITYDVQPAVDTIKSGLLSEENKAIVGKAKEDVYKEEFVQRANTKEATYIEISISQQLMWVYKDNELVILTPIVTGNEQEDWGTPVGKYTIIEKTRNEVLDGATVGFDYKVTVDYWMRLTTSGIGIHDIDWLTSYNAWDSRQVYLYDGSHGCINVPNDVMSQVYEAIPMGTSVYITE